MKRVRAPSVWRESVLSAVQTVRSAPVLLPQLSPAHHPANTPTGKVGIVASDCARTDEILPGFKSLHWTD